MAEGNKITNTFEGGLNWDDYISLGDNKDYRYAENIIGYDDEQTSFKNNEHSTREIIEFSGNVVGKKYITQLDSSIIFIEGGEIHLYNHAKEEIKLVAKASDFGCTWGMTGCEWIDIHNYYEYINDLWVTYSSNKIYYNINITELLDEKRKEGLIKSLSLGCGEGCAQRTCEYFKVFKKTCEPHIEAIALDGGNLRNGTYFIGGRYVNSQGAYSNPFVMSTAIHIGGKDNVAGEFSSKRININVTSNGCIFDQIEFFIHEIIGGEIITKVLPPKYISGNSFSVDYNNNETATPVDLSELMVNGRTNIEGEDLVVYNNRAIYYRTTPDFEYNFQSIANRVEVNWYAVKIPLVDVKKYNIKSFLRGETYAFCISPNYISGKKGYGFHIPGTPGGGDCASFPYMEPEEEVHITGGKNKKPSGYSGSDNPAQCVDGEIKLLSGGCLGTEVVDMYLDTDNYCTATKMYSSKDELKLADKGVYKLNYPGNSFVREWDGEKFIKPCLICLDSSEGGGGGSCSNKASISGTQGFSSSSTTDIKTRIIYERIRGKVPSTVNNPSDEIFTEMAKDIVEAWQMTSEDIMNTISPAISPDEGCINCGESSSVNLETTEHNGCEDCDNTGTISGELNVNIPIPKDELNQYANVKKDIKDRNIMEKDAAKVEEIGALWFNALSNYIYEETETADNSHTRSDNNVNGESPAQLLKNPVRAVKQLREAASDLINASQNRERTVYKYSPYEVSKEVTYDKDVLPENESYTSQSFTTVPIDVTYDEEGNILSTPNKPIEVLPGVFKKYPIVAKGKTRSREESNTYPCIVDCYGNQIYCGLGGSNVTHHEFPSNTEVPYWIPKSDGDGSTVQTDSSIMDGYAVVLGVEFTNVNVPDQVKGFLCATNPFTFGVVPRNTNNSSIIMKGLGTEMYTGINQNKTYLYYKYGLNSMEKVSKYIDSDGAGKRFERTSDDPNNINIYSIDQSVRTPYLNGTHIRREGTFKAKGARHSLYSKGLEDKDNRAKRKDNGGSIHTVMVNSFTAANDDQFEIQGQVYADANMAISPSLGSMPFMNKSGQACAWITAEGVARGLNDDTFVGDVLEDTAVIEDGVADYYSIVRNVDSLYGDITSLNYAPIIQARGFNESVRGLVGDSYIGVYTFVKTGYVSDKVGNFFPISNMVPGKADRSICDCPEDAAHSLVGNWYWKELPINGDAADAKRWAGTHTGDKSKTNAEARLRNTESHYYYPAVTKHLIEYVGESEANPWLRTRGDLLSEQVADNLMDVYTLHPKANTGGDWDISYLSQYYKLIEQASLAQMAMKVLLLSFINLALPLLGINDFVDSGTIPEFAGDFLTAVMEIAVWVMLSQVLFSNDFVDRLLRLDPCTRDEEGGERQFIENWFENYSTYNNDYSMDYFYPTIRSIPMQYTGCISTTAVSNTYYISEMNSSDSYINGYQVVKPNSKVSLEEIMGKITKMYVIGGYLFIHTTGGIYKTMSGNVTSPSTVGEMILGTSSVLSYPQLMTSNGEGGSFGLLHPNHGKLIDRGFVFVDYNAKSLYLFTGSEFEFLSGPRSKMYNFFDKYLTLCTKTDCSFEQKEGTNYYSFSVDIRYNRLLFTKHDKQFSYTLSYDFGSKRWISFHSYLPMEYLTDRGALYSIYNKKLYKHDDYAKYTTYYDTFYGITIDFTATADQVYFDWINTEVFTEARQGFNRDLDITFNQVAIANNWQSTGYIDLNVNTNWDILANVSEQKIKDKVTSIDIKRLPSSFRFNEVFDYTLNHNEPTIIKENCNPKPVIVNYGDYTDRSSQAYTDRIVSDNYQYYRFIFNTFDNIKLYLKKIDTYINRKPY